MSKITRIINEAKAFANTNAGQVAVSGLGYIATMAICGSIAAKFFPGKATFGRALGLGIYAVRMQTIVGTSTASEQQQRLEWSEESFATYRKEMREEIVRLRSEMFHLKEQLSEKEKELEGSAEELNRLRRSAEADMAGTMKHVEELEAKLAAQEQELKHDRLALKGYQADMAGTVRQLYKLRDENADLRSVLEEIRKERNSLRDTEDELVKQRDELKARKNGIVYPRPRKSEVPLACPAVEELLGRLLSNA